ncbi:MAG: RNA polymerase sigma factor [Candidatus Azambacteria bacterium]|nr:RNA polymerase sigma factor [Candidatus Azambacteria bacterium]
MAMHDKQSKEFMALYDQYSDAIFRFTLFKVSNKETAWDLTQECFFKTWQHLSKDKKAITNTKAFLYTVARNLVIDYWRSKEKHATVDIEAASYVIDDGNDVHHEAVLQDEARYLLRLLKNIPEESREILTLRYTDGLSFEEIAVITGKSNVAIRVHTHRALKKLRSYMKDADTK